MIKTDIYIPYDYNTDIIKSAISRHLPIEKQEIKDISILRRELVIKDGCEPAYKTSIAFSADSAKELGLLKIRNKTSEYQEEVFFAEPCRMDFRPVIAGAGPAGLFAALTLAEAGTRPIVLERGLDVDKRRERIRTFEALGILDPECNVQFGEGGAGTYSDGKLKTGSKDKYKLRVLREFYDSGADESILYSTNAHLGTDKLPAIVSSLRNKIIRLGGEFIYSARFCGFEEKNGRLSSVTYIKDGSEHRIETSALILAIGHSARDTIRMLYDSGLKMTGKGFGVGMRAEHPREYINSLIYRSSADIIKESASYHLVTHLAGGRSVYSFCMCPGGSVVAATSTDGSVVTNGMSEYSRMSDNSNAAVLVSVTPEDFGSTHPLAGIEFQERIERRAYSLSGSYKAPATRLGDFMNRRADGDFGSVMPSYPLGTEHISADSYLPDFICDSMRLGFSDFDAWCRGYMLADAVLTGPETRTTSPVRIERTSSGETLGFEGIYPAGEGAGYAGGIVSSAVDGIRCAEKLMAKYPQK